MKLREVAAALLLSVRVCVYAIVGLMAVTVQSRAGGADEAYVKKATWPETMLASRARYLKSRKVEPKKPVEIGPWHATGPHRAKRFADKLFPEKGIDLGAKARNGKPLWRTRAEWSDGRVHNLPNTGSASTYLYRTITVARPMDMPVGLGSDDGLALWLNGKKVITRDVRRGVAANQDKAVLKLKRGENKVLFKIFNAGGGHGFYFSSGHKAADSAVTPLWKRIERDFRAQADSMKRDCPGGPGAWFERADNVKLEKRMIGSVLGELGGAGGALKKELDSLGRAGARPDDRRWLDLYERACRIRGSLAQMKHMNVGALRLAVEDLTRTFPHRYKGYLERLTKYESTMSGAASSGAPSDGDALKRLEEIVDFRREALLANPLISFDKLLLVRRDEKSPKLGLPQNWQGNCAIRRTGYDNEIAVLSPVGPHGKLTTLFKPPKGEFVGDFDLNFVGDRMIFSMPGSHGRWQIWEIGADGKGLRQVTSGEHSDFDNYDACYLPDGRIIYGSTSCFHGIPCVGGGNTVANLCIMDADGKNVRQLCFDQDHNWCPTVLNNGRVMYTRWEYSDSPHYFSRLLFHMNPDGTSQMQYYGSNSYWPNSLFYARPIPGHPTKVVAIVSGHHGVPRMGEMVILDPARSRHEATGAVQQIPGYKKKVPPKIADSLVNSSWPKFLHPYPLSEKYFLVSCKPTSSSRWGIYLVDVFDNMLLILEQPGYAMLEPVPFRKTPRPPEIPDRVKLDRRDASIYLSNVYVGEGLRGVPRGTVKRLRVTEIHFAYPRMGGHICIGIDGPWDVHRILGTVPVYEDGSALFRVPANTPLSVQPLDEEGKALQVMRSWYTAMPGELASCVGCHEGQNSGPPSKRTIAARKEPSPIEPWYGPARGFGFKREVQPVLDKYCVGCHNGKPRGGKTIPNFADTGRGWRNFTKSYVALHPYVRRPGPESDYHIQKPCEWHADTSELIQMLRKGHNGVKLNAEAWDRLVTWIDLNVPDHGTWGEFRKVSGDLRKRRLEMRTLYANRPEDPEAYPTPAPARPAFVKPAPISKQPARAIRCAGWPMDAAEAAKRQTAAGASRELKIDLGGGKTMELVLVPAGEFVMGDAKGFADERPLARVKIAKPFYLGKFEVTNEQYGVFDPTHDSAYISVYNKDQGNRGIAANGSRQPVIRITWKQASAFCGWLSRKTGRRFSLPSEAEWEYACRAGTDTPLNYGERDADFSKHANLADQRVLSLCRRDSPKWIPSVKNVNDGSTVTDNVDRRQPNAWGLHGMHGNVCEWTRTAYRPYPYRNDGRNDPRAAGRKAARGGSFYDRPGRSRSGMRVAYHPWQPVFNVGFRVVCGTGPAGKPGSDEGRLTRRSPSAR